MATNSEATNRIPGAANDIAITKNGRERKRLEGKWKAERRRKWGNEKGKDGGKGEMERGRTENRGKWKREG